MSGAETLRLMCLSAHPDDESLGFGSPLLPAGGFAVADLALANTKYGREFLAIRGTRAAAAPIFISAC